MAPEAVVKCLTSVKPSESVQMQIILQSAPVLKNVKMSSLFTVPAGYSRVVCSFLFKTGIKFCRLCTGAKKDIVLLYREDPMAALLEQKAVTEFLKQFGYKEGTLKQYLQFLGQRISFYYNQSQEFPHETGVFLGYPLEDVKGFIEHEGKNCSCIGYWKVYSDVERAKKMFQTFDEAKDAAVAEFFSGKNIREITC